MNAVVGIDPGKHGGFAILDTHVGSHVQVHPLNLDNLVEWLRVVDTTVDGALFVYIEEVHAMPKQGVTSMFNFGLGYGRVRGIVEGLGLPLRLVRPQVWKKSVLGPAYPHDKPGTIQWAKDQYPAISLIPPRCRVEHDGCADALAIAHFGFHKEFCCE